MVDTSQPLAVTEARIDGLISITQWAVGVIDDLSE
jgi:hypothetical protein